VHGAKSIAQAGGERKRVKLEKPSAELRKGFADAATVLIGSPNSARW